MSPAVPPINTSSTVSSTSTLVPSPLALSPREKERNRTNDLLLDAESKEAESEITSYGGDVPTQVRERALSRGAAMARRMTGRSVGSRTQSGSGFQDLHLTDSAFDDGNQLAVDAKIDSNKVIWQENDPENPQNWDHRKKMIVTAIAIILTINVTFASTAPSSATQAFAVDLSSTLEIAVLCTSLFLFGYCLGPILWAPLSELFGRRIIFITTMFAYSVLQLGEAVSPTMTALLIIRFLSGVFASAPLTNAGGVIADIWDALGRGPAMSIFSASVFIGPVIGPIVGGYVTDSYLTWRWIFWIQAIIGFACSLLVAFFLPETYAPVLLGFRAKKLRKEEPEKNADLYAEIERADFSLGGIITRTLSRPFVMLGVEPILLLVTIYMSLIYGLLYALFSVYPLVFGNLRGFSLGQIGLAFIGVGIGTSIGAAYNIYLQRHYKELVPKWHGSPPPEQRLWGAMLAGPFLVVGIFFFGWTGYNASIPWYVPCIATIILGVSFTLVFISFLTYLIEVYLMYAASALAANTIIRSAVGGAFPLFTDQFFNRLGIQWACTLIGCLAILIAPVPIFFYHRGARIRAGSKFAPCLDLKMRERVEREEKEQEAEREKSVVKIDV